MEQDDVRPNISRMSLEICAQRVQAKTGEIPWPELYSDKGHTLSSLRTRTEIYDLTSVFSRVLTGLFIFSTEPFPIVESIHEQLPIVPAIAIRKIRSAISSFYVALP